MKLKFTKISLRITLCFAMLILISFSLITFFVGQVYCDKLTIELKLIIEQKNKLITHTMDKSLETIRDLYFSIQKNERIQDLFARTPTPINLSKLKTELLAYKNISSDILSIQLVSSNLTILDSLVDADSILYKLIKGEEFTYFINSNLSGYFSIPNTYPYTIDNPSINQKINISYLGHYYGLDYKHQGYVIINFKKDFLTREIRSLITDSFDSTYILDDKNNIIYKNGDMLQDKKYFTYSSHSAVNPNWVIVTSIDYNYISSKMREFYITIFFICFLVLFLSILTSYYISNKITQPIRKLVSSMKILGTGIFPPKQSLNTNDEISILINGYNDLMDNIEKLSNDIINEQEAKKNYELEIVNSHLQLLQSQINPHFIHNTLNTMKYLAQKENQTELFNLICSFNTLLRSTINQKNPFCTVTEEVSNLHHYVKIQRHRYDADISLDIDVPSTLMLATIPNLILQPLVENAIFHGIIPKGGGKIIIHFTHKSHSLIVKIFDNGIGIDTCLINSVLLNNSHTTQGYTSIGLKNVNDRLQLYYGGKSCLSIQSKKYLGTLITFSLPINYNLENKESHT